MSETVDVTIGGEGVTISALPTGTYTLQRPKAKCPHGHIGEPGTLTVYGGTVMRKYGPICWDCYGAWMAATFPTTECDPETTG